MNLKLQHVFSDIDGMCGQAIVDAILAGERDAKKLAALRDDSCAKPSQRAMKSSVSRPPKWNAR